MSPPSVKVHLHLHAFFPSTVAQKKKKKKKKNIHTHSFRTIHTSLRQIYLCHETLRASAGTKFVQV